jgi:hypothetical protein
MERQEEVLAVDEISMSSLLDLAGTGREDSVKQKLIQLERHLKRIDTEIGRAVYYDDQNHSNGNLMGGNVRTAIKSMIESGRASEIVPMEHVKDAIRRMPMMNTECLGVVIHFENAVSITVSPKQLGLE